METIINEIKPEQLRSHIVTALEQLSQAYGRSEQWDAALACQLSMLPIHRTWQGHSNIAHCLMEQGKYDQAFGELQTAQSLAKEPSHDLFFNMGVNCACRQQHAKAVDYYRQAQALEYRPLTQFNLGCSLLSLGQWQPGWDAYEARWDAYEPAAANLARHKTPYWDGSPVDNLLVFHEQGMGDHLQYCRFISRLHELGVQNVAVEVPGPLKPLYTGKVSMKKPDAVVGICSLAKFFKEYGQNPYIKVNNPIYLGSGFKVGLCWAGSKTNKTDKWRSMFATHLKPLLELPARFFSLQVGRDECGYLNVNKAQLNDYRDTARLIAGLDLVISVDTSVAHLAGAMGVPVIVLSSFIQDFRWAKVEQWYPSATVLTQRKLGEWTEVITQAYIRLEKLCH